MEPAGSIVPTAVDPNGRVSGARPSTAASMASLTSTRKFEGSGSGRKRVPLLKQQHVLKPLPRSPPGSVYSKKMTLGCKPSSSSRKMRAKKNRAGAAAGKYGVQPAVRSMLPWWHHSASKTSEGSIATGATIPETEADHEADVALHNTPNRGIGVEAPSRAEMPELTPNYPVEERLQRRRPDGGSGTVSPQSTGKQTAVEKTADNEGQHGANEYTHYTNLFENPPPSIPAVDQYIFDDNILYEAITKRGQSKALPLNTPGGGVLGIQGYGDAPWAAAGVSTSCGGELEPYVDPQDLLYADEDIDKLLNFFDHMGFVDNRVTLEEMILGFRKIRREWATVKAEKAGRAVLAKVVRLMERAGMSLEDWFRFMDMSQNGRGDGKLTALELRSGLERLVTHIARRECCCRAYKCDRIPNYGLPRHKDARAPPSAKDEVGTAGRANSPGPSILRTRGSSQASPGSQGHDQDASEALQSRGSTVSFGFAPDPRGIERRDATAADPCSGYDDAQHNQEDGQPNEEVDINDLNSGEAGPQSREDRQRRHNQRRAGGADAAESTCNRHDCGDCGEEDPSALGRKVSRGLSTGDGSDRVVGRSEKEFEDASKAEELEPRFYEDVGREKPSVGLSLSGTAIACREHALEGMVYLGQRAYFLGLEKETLLSKEISDLMRFIDTDVNFTLDLGEMRLAMSRMRSCPDEEASTRLSEAGHLLEVLEQYMHKTGARFTDVFSLLDRDRSGFLEKHELRSLFETLSREPARRRARAKAKAELAAEKLRQQEIRAIEAQGAAIKLEMIKKAGVYSVLKRIEVWQTRTGKRLSEGFHGGTGVGTGNRGLDVDELAAFMRNLDLDLSPSEAMSVLRHLNGENSGLVEVKEIAAAVRSIRRYEGIIKAAKTKTPCTRPGTCNGGRVRPPSLADASKLLAGGSLSGNGAILGKGWGGDDDGNVGGYGSLWEGPAAPGLGRQVSSLERLMMPAGPFVFRPPIGVITHGRASSAPARGRRTTHGSVTATKRRPTTAAAAAAGTAAKTSTPYRGGLVRTASLALCGGKVEGDVPPTTTDRGLGARGRSGSSVSGSIDTSLTRQHSLAGRSPRLAQRLLEGRSSVSGFSVGVAAARGVDTTTNRASVGVSGTSSVTAASGSGQESLPPWELGLRIGLAGSGASWPAAESAVEDGSRLDIYTGSVLEGRWLNSLDSRLRATMRATRR